MNKIDKKLLNDAVDMTLHILEEAEFSTNIETKIDIVEKIYFEVVSKKNMKKPDKDFIENISSKISSVNFNRKTRES